MLFNRFLVERDGDLYVVYFGYVSASTATVDCYACAITKDAIKATTADTLQYLSRSAPFVGEQEDPSPENWRPPSTLMRLDVADVVNMSHRGTVAEVSLVAYSLNSAMQLHKSGEQKPLEGIGVAILRSSLIVQRRLIEALYVEEGE
jgi:hypothetical protein